MGYQLIHWGRQCVINLFNGVDSVVMVNKMRTHQTLQQVMESCFQIKLDYWIETRYHRQPDVNHADHSNSVCACVSEPAC